MLEIEMSLVPIESTKNFLQSNLQTPFKDVMKNYRTWKVMYAKHPTPNQNSGWING